MDTQYETYKRDLEDFKKVTTQFYNKEVSVKDYKGYSGKYGSYAQRGQERSMLRLRMNGGRITKEKLKFIADSIQSKKIEKIHFTTCQTVQLHNLKPDTVSELILDALAHDIITWGGGGDYPRNVMASPLSGVERGEYFDIMPYAEAATDYLMDFIDKVKLPRKLKVGFSNSPQNETHVTFRDFGFAASKDGTFTVYSAGGLGNNPKMGVCIEHGVSPDKILYYLKAMIDTFMANGNYGNRGKARTRYMQDSLGTTGYADAYKKALKKVMAEESKLDLNIGTADIAKKGDTFAISHKRAVQQKQEGLYAISYHPIGGTPAITKMSEIYETIKNMDQVELRLTPNQGVYIINCTGSEAQKVLAVTADGADSLFESSVACIGASICQVGVRDSQKLLHSLTAAMKKCGFQDGVLPQIHISGCPSSCGTHQIGRLGFHGGVKVIDKIPYPAFTLHVNGIDAEGQERFGEQLGTILEEDIPLFLEKVGHAVTLQNTMFDDWIKEHENDLKEIAAEFIR